MSINDIKEPDAGCYLLQKHGKALLEGIYLGDINATIELVIPAIKKISVTGLEKEIAALAYIIGVEQGVHNERARRKDGSGG